MFRFLLIAAAALAIANALIGSTVRPSTDSALSAIAAHNAALAASVR